MLVSELLSSSTVTVPADQSAQHALRMAAAQSTHYLLVVDGAEELVGVVCVCDLNHAHAADAVACRMRLPAFVAVDDALDQVEAVMEQCGTGCVVVLDDDGVLQGVVTHADLRRELGTGPGSACSLCGATENLKPVRCVEAPRFCAECAERARYSAPISFRR